MAELELGGRPHWCASNCPVHTLANMRSFERCSYSEAQLFYNWSIVPALQLSWLAAGQFYRTAV